MSRTYFVLAFLLFPSLSFSQDTLIGRVLDHETGDPLISATIQIGNSGAYSDGNGYFSILIDNADNQLVVRYIGYQTFRQSISPPVAVDTIQIGLKPDENMLNAVTVSAGKYEQPLGETTVSIETLKPELLRQSNITSLDDVLDKVPGVQIIDGQANIRGGSGFSYGAGSRVLMLIDDIPAYQPDAGFPNWDDFPIENVSQIEVVKGASSVLYGSSALNGTINLRTAYATDEPVTRAFGFYRTYLSPKDPVKKWWSMAPYEYGFGVQDARRLGKIDLVNSIYYLDRNSFQKENYNHYGRLNSKLRYRINEKLEVGIGANINRGMYQSFFFWQNDQEGAYQGDSSNYNTGDYFRFNVDPYLKFVNRAGDRHEVKGRISHVNNENNDGRSNISTLYYGEYQYLRRLNEIEGVLTMGLVGIHTRIDAELYGDTTFYSDNYAAYLQFEKKFYDRITAQAGVRYERNVITGPSLVDGQQIKDGKTIEARPVLRFGLNYELTPYTFLRVSWGQGYRFPTIAEKFITTTFGGLQISPNLSLESETGWSGEVGIKQGFSLGDFQGIFDVAGFWSEYFNMMEFVFTGLIKGFQSQNVGDTRISGIDVSVNGRGELFGMNTTVLAGYTYIDPVYQEFTMRDSLSSSVDYNILKYRTKHQFKFDVQAEFKRLALGWSFQHISNMEAIDAIFQFFVPGLADFRETHKGYTVSDVRLIYQLNDQIKLTGLMRNVFNAEYSVRPGLLADPRNFALRFDVSL